MDKQIEKENEEDCCLKCKYFPYNCLKPVDMLSKNDVSRIRAVLGNALGCLEEMEFVLYRKDKNK